MMWNALCQWAVVLTEQSHPLCSHERPPGHRVGGPAPAAVRQRGCCGNFHTACSNPYKKHFGSYFYEIPSLVFLKFKHWQQNTTLMSI